MTNPPDTVGQETREGLGQLDALLETMRRLRAPVGGCPWDLEQTHASLQHTLLEESYEAMEALETGNVPDMVEELGDLLIQVVFHAQIGADNGTFTIGDVARHANDKLVRRHPHVFGHEEADTPEAVKLKWDQVKAQEREAKGQADRSLLDGVPKTMPALGYAQAVQERAARSGLVREEGGMDQLGSETQAIAALPTQEQREARLGELLFSLVDASRTWEVEAEDALRGANRRFYERFTQAERASRAQSQG